MKSKVKRFLRCAGKAVLWKIPKWIAKAVGLDVVADMVEVAADFRKNWLAEVTEAQARAELQCIAQPMPSAQFNLEVAEVVAEIAADEPPEVRRGLASYLSWIPTTTRQALKRPADPSGTTVPATLPLKSAADVIGLLPMGLPQFEPGERPDCLRGDWELVELLGRGGQGEVWKARRVDDAHFRAAFKFCTNGDAQRQLQREKDSIRRVKQANLPGIVALEDYKLDSSPPWLRYELIDGGDLAGLVHEWNETNSPPNLPFVSQILQRLAGTIGRFHRLDQPVIHRDLKPPNILVRRVDGRYQFLVADFGISHIAAQRGLEQAMIGTPSGLSLGTMRYACTPLYASLQQQRGDDPDPRDDVFALGVIWYQLLLRDLARGAPTGLGWVKRLRAMGLSKDHVALLGACMAEDPDDRPNDAHDLRDQLAALASGQTLSSPPAPVDLPDAPSTESLAERVRRLKVEAAAQHADVRALLELHDYEAATELFENFHPDLIPLRDPALYGETRARRDQLRQIHAAIHACLDKGKLKEPRLPQMIADYLEIKSNDAAMLELAREFPLPKRGQTITNSLGMKFAWVPAGKSWLGGGGGNPGQDPFTLPNGFWCAIHPVTQAQWHAVMGDAPSHFKGNPRFPVESVSWNRVQEFLTTINKKQSKDGLTYRLPTEREWEYICRGGPLSQDQTKFHYYFAKSETELTPAPTNDLTGRLANFGGKQPTDVGSFLPNPLGIHDMHGNVWEWTSSSEGSARVVRGGGWYNDAVCCTASYRNSDGPGEANDGVGFRLLAVPSDGQ